MKHAIINFKNIALALVMLSLLAASISAHEKTFVGTSQAL